MDAVKLSGLEPKAVMGYFEKLCSMPHGSGNTKQISDYLVSFAKEHGLRYIQDAVNNVILFGDGTCGYEDHEPVIIQGHMDMVCEKDADCPINMETDGLDITHDGTNIFARGTSLGGDNCIAVAYGLALLADNTIPHPPIELVCTVDEETTMLGAESIDMRCLKGRRMINIDSGREGYIIVSCAGGSSAEITVPVTRRAVSGPCVKLTVTGLLGGHSGSNIHMNRASANKVMAEFLSRIQKLTPICITQLQGGNKSNAITRSCEATVVALDMPIKHISDIAQELQDEIRAQYIEPDAIVRVEEVDAFNGDALTTESTANLIDLLRNLPFGVMEWDKCTEDQVQTSMNIGIIKLEADFYISLSARSTVNNEKAELMDRMKGIVKAHGGQFNIRWQCSAWEFKKDSPLQNTLTRVYKDMYGQAMKTQIIHGILECGTLCAKMPELDCVSIGPNMRDLHTSRETLDIASVKRTWDYLQEVLKAL